ncbi:MAG: GTP-binding protein [Promethearchaeota archaeon]|nr:MAG: GTP-binding protein [Candidatus Lokiarchaeota archaeon]
MADEYDYLFKSIVVGDGGVGKTALTLRFSKGFFTEDYKMTIGVDFHVKTISIDTQEEGQIMVKLQIWDTGGQERFSSIRPMYYRGALGALLIFDLTSYESFEHLPQWIEEIRSNIKNEVPFLLVGNKSDLVDIRAVSLEEINDFTEKFNLYYMETSAKTGEGVGDCFYILACLMVGSGVPDQLVSKGIVSSPGNVLVATSAPVATPLTQQEPEEFPAYVIEPEPQNDFAAPPVPEPQNDLAAPPVPEPQNDLAAPPVPEPQNDLAAPPVPEPAPKLEQKAPIPEPKIETTAEKPTEFEFKTPEQILSEVGKEEEPLPSSSVPTISETPEEPTYKPKTIPFAGKIPKPAPTPEEFQTPDSDSLVDYMPETILSKKEMKRLEKQKKKEEKQKKKEEKEKAKLEKERKIQEEKERERLEKEKAKLEKERKIQEEKEREIQEKEKAKLEKEKKKKKEKVKKVTAEPRIPLQTATPTPPEQESRAPSFFQTMSQKSSESNPSEHFVPFTATEKPTRDQDTEIKIIPNVADIIQPKTPSGTKTNDITSLVKPAQAQKKKETIICSQCGAMLSSDYAFCNKCGSKL